VFLNAVSILFCLMVEVVAVGKREKDIVYKAAIT